MPDVSTKKILIVRNDKLGDFMLSFPVFAALKLNIKDCETHALVPQYTREMAESCQWIDHVILDPGRAAPISSQYKFLSGLRHTHYDAAITLFSTTRTGLFNLLAGIPVRLAPATKIAQVFYNRRITQRRSRSIKPEYEYNLDLAKAYLAELGIHNPTMPEPPYLTYAKDEIARLRKYFVNQHGISPEKQLIFVHSGSGGSANNLSAEQYADLIKRLSTNDDLHFVLTAGPGEEQGAGKVSSLIRDIRHTIYISAEGLDNFAKHIAFAWLFIAGSTGPLHIAGALNIPTVGFYTRRRSATPLRWQTLNTEDKRLALTPPGESEAEDMSSIEVEPAAKEIADFLARLNQH